MNEQSASENVVTKKQSYLTRREFIKDVGVVLAALFVPYIRKPSKPIPISERTIIPPKGQLVAQSRTVIPARQLEGEKPIKVDDKTSLTNTVAQSHLIPPKRQIEGEKTTQADEKPSFTDTAVKSALLFLADIVSTPILKALKIPVGNAGMDLELIKELMEKPFHKTLLLGGVAIPLVEEILFRALPNMLIAGHQKKDVWEIGLPTSALFALAHNFKVDKSTEKFIFATDEIPLEQFIFGLFFWKMMRERGFPHAVVGHATINSAGLTVAKILYEVFPDLKKPLK